MKREVVTAFMSLTKALLLKNLLLSFHDGFTFGYDEKFLRSYLLGTV